MKTKALEKIFEGRNVIIEMDEKGNPIFEIESTSMAIGYVTKSSGKEYVHKTRMNKTLKNAEITPFVHGVQKFMTLNQLYDFLIEAQTYDDLMNTEGLMPINRVAKELGIGEYKLFKFLRNKKIFFYDKDMINLPYERFRKEGKFKVKETPCQDGEIRSVTYATKKGLEYIRKLLRKDGYYDIVTE